MRIAIAYHAFIELLDYAIQTRVRWIELINAHHTLVSSGKADTLIAYLECRE